MIIICVCWFELFSQVSDVAHGPLVNVFCSHFNIVAVLNSIYISFFLSWLFTWKKNLYMFICFVVVHHKSCIDMVKIIIHSLTRNNYQKTYRDFWPTKSSSGHSVIFHVTDYSIIHVSVPQTKTISPLIITCDSADSGPLNEYMLPLNITCNRADSGPLNDYMLPSLIVLIFDYTLQSWMTTVYHWTLWVLIVTVQWLHITTVFDF